MISLELHNYCQIRFNDRHFMVVRLMFLSRMTLLWCSRTSCHCRKTRCFSCDCCGWFVFVSPWASHLFKRQFNNGTASFQSSLVQSFCLLVLPLKRLGKQINCLLKKLLDLGRLCLRLFPNFASCLAELVMVLSLLGFVGRAECMP